MGLGAQGEGFGNRQPDIKEDVTGSVIFVPDDHYIVSVAFERIQSFRRGGLGEDKEADVGVSVLSGNLQFVQCFRQVKGSVLFGFNHYLGSGSGRFGAKLNDHIALLIVPYLSRRIASVGGDVAGVFGSVR